MCHVHFHESSAVHRRAAALFEALSRSLSTLLPFADIQHVGSTAIDGSITKGDLDISVRVRGRDFEKADHLLAQHFQRNLESDRNEWFASFKNDESDPPFGIQLILIDGPYDVFVIWRDLLRADPELARRYDALKRDHHGTSLSAYRTAKSAFIERVLSEHAGR